MYFLKNKTCEKEVLFMNRKKKNDILSELFCLGLFQNWPFYCGSLFLDYFDKFYSKKY